MKVKAYFFETDDGSDDPRAIQGGGGPTETLVRTACNSSWLIRAYIRAYANRYGDTLIVRFGREAF
jgi:hypothetical protein